MDLEIRHLRLVTAIAETGSVTRASERLFLTAPRVSGEGESSKPGDAAAQKADAPRSRVDLALR